MPKFSYKQKYMREFKVTSEEYDKLYDVYALRARRYEKIIGEKLNKAKEFYWTKKLQNDNQPISIRRKSISESLASSKPIKQSEEDRINKAYIELYFMGLILQNKQLQRIYYDTSLSWKQKRELIEKWLKKWDEEKEKAAKQAEEKGTFEESDGSTGYDSEYEL